MPLFQQSVLKKYISDLDKALLQSAWQLFQQHFFNIAIQQNIRDAKEEEYQEGFIRDLFVNVLGYTLNPQPDYNFVLEKKSVTDSTKSDGAVLLKGEVIAVVELKDTGTPDLDKVSNQAFGYKHKHKNCIYVITSNFEKLRFYINDSTDYEEFDLFALSQEKFALLYLCMQKQNLLANIPLQIKQASLVQEQNVTKELYADYSLFKRKLFQNIAEQNPQHDKLLLFKKTQKLLDRFLFILFAEDRLLLPPNSVREILAQWEQLKELDNYVPLYNRFKKYFGYLNVGHQGKQHEIFAYNGGLFLPDDILDAIVIDDNILYEGTKTLSEYDFETDVDVNILGHIFEHSLTEIEKLQQELEGKAIEKNKSKRKKEGVFYTPRYITKYIVENTVGALCTQKKDELQINEETFAPKKRKDRRKALLDTIEAYRNWLLQLTICDPACGSGAFLNAALEYLKAEHRTADELTARMLDVPIVFTDLDNSILENNLYGVDINEDAIEISKLSLWLHTAKKGRKLSNLSDNIKCGNSLIDDASVAGDKAFKWKEEFKNIFDNGGFDVVIGNPPYGAELREISFLKKIYSFKKFDSYELFVERSKKINKQNGIVGLIIPNSWMTHKEGKYFRSFLFKLNIEVLINFKNKVFQDANIDTVILIFSTSTSVNNIIKAIDVQNPEEILIIENYNHIKQTKFQELDKVVCSFSPKQLQVIDKLHNNANKIDDFFTVIGGYKPYQVGYGKSLNGNFPQIESDIKYRVYHSSFKVNESYYPDIKGSNISRYFINKNSQWVNWGSWLMSPKKIEYFLNPKIVVREIAGKYLFASYDDSGYFTNDTTHMILSNGNVSEMKSLLGIINSKLYGWYFKSIYAEDSNLFPKLKINEIKSLPLMKDFNKSELTSKADIMLSKNKELNQSLQQLTQLLQSKFATININNKLQNWASLTSNEFFKELTKQKIKLPLSEQQEWLQYFEAEKIKANNIQQVIQQTDEEIDKMVYELYGLSAEEVGIIENKE